MGMSKFIPFDCLLPCNLNALDETADIAHPRDEASTSWPPKGCLSGVRPTNACLTFCSKSRRNRHLLFTCLVIHEFDKISCQTANPQGIKKIRLNCTFDSP